MAVFDLKRMQVATTDMHANKWSLRSGCSGTHDGQFVCQEGPILSLKLKQVLVALADEIVNGTILLEAILE